MPKPVSGARFDHHPVGDFPETQLGAYSPGVNVTVDPLMLVTITFCDCAAPAFATPEPPCWLAAPLNPLVWLTQMFPGSAASSFWVKMTIFPMAKAVVLLKVSDVVPDVMVPVTFAMFPELGN